MADLHGGHTGTLDLSGSDDRGGHGLGDDTALLHGVASEGGGHVAAAEGVVEQ